MSEIGTPADWVAEGERRAVREWQAERREKCDECLWVQVRSLDGCTVRHLLLDPCERHGGDK